MSMRHATRAIRWLLPKMLPGMLLGILLGPVGCFSLGRTAPPQNYFVLGGDSLWVDVPTSPEVAALAVGVRRATVASYLASPFITVRRGPNQVDLSQVNRWGEALDAGITRVVARDLVSRGFRDAVVVPWPVQARYDYVIQIDVLRFEGLALGEPGSVDGGVHMLATWEILGQKDGVVLARGTTDYRRPGWRVGDYGALVSLLDGGLDQLAGDLTAGVIRLVASRPPPSTPGPGVASASPAVR